MSGARKKTNKKAQPRKAQPKKAQPRKAQAAAKSAPQRGTGTSAGNRPVSREQQRKTNRAYNQATVHRTKKSRKHGSRGSNYVIYYFLGAIAVIIVLIILANTVLFNCTSIAVEGNSRYTAEQIIAPSGLELGQNLLHIDTDSAESRISAALTYIDSVEVKRSFPTKMVITVTEAEKWYLVTDNGVTAAVSRMGRIVELGEESGLPVVEGYDPEELTAGAQLVSTESGKTDIPSQIFEAAEKHGISGITRVDITDRFDITVDCGDNITLALGGISDIDSKLSEAAAIMEQEQANVTINLRSLEKVFVRDKVNDQTTLPEISSTAEAQTAQAATGEAEGANQTAEQ